MARSNLAYRREVVEQSYDAQPMPSPRSRLRTIEGNGRKTAAQAQVAPWTNTLIAMSIVVAVVLATVSIARVTIANATVQMMQTAVQTQAAIDFANAAGIDLEVKHSLANNPTKIQDLAASMGILPSSQPVTLAAQSGFSEETIAQMQLAALEVRQAHRAEFVGTKVREYLAKPAPALATTATKPEGEASAQAVTHEDSNAAVAGEADAVGDAGDAGSTGDAGAFANANAYANANEHAYDEPAAFDGE